MRLKQLRKLLETVILIINRIFRAFNINQIYFKRLKIYLNGLQDFKCTYFSFILQELIFLTLAFKKKQKQQQQQKKTGRYRFS